MAAEEAVALCRAESDEERFVGLMLGARLIPSVKDPCDLALQLCKATGLVFLERLLRTDALPGTLSASFRPLAMKVSSIAAGNALLDADPHWHSLTAVVTAFLCGPNADLAEDAHRFICLSCTRPATRAAVLCQLALRCEELLGDVQRASYAARACSVLQEVAQRGTPDAPDDGASRAVLQNARALCTAAWRWSQSQDEVQFNIVRTLQAWMEAHGTCIGPLTQAGESLHALRCALGRWLSTRLPAVHRRSVLVLCATFIRHLGTAWTVGPAEGLKFNAAGHGAGGAPLEDEGDLRRHSVFTHLLVHMACVELSMLLRPLAASAGEPSADDATALVACSEVVETAISEINTAGHSWEQSLDDASMLGIQRALVGAVENIAQYVEDTVADKGGRDQAIAVVGRVVAAWMSQPSSAVVQSTYERLVKLAPVLRAAVIGLGGTAPDWVDVLC